MAAPIQCICMGSKLPHTEGQCSDAATQEDFLCDHCREHQCWTVETYDEFYERFNISPAAF